MEIVNLEVLKRKGKFINWRESVDSVVNFKDDNKIYKIKITGYNGKKLKVEYDNITYEISTGPFLYGNIGNIIGTKTSLHKLKKGDTINDGDRNITIIDLGRDSKNKTYKYECNNCGFKCGEHYSIKDNELKSELWITESNLLNNNRGCSCCCSGSKIVVADINSIYAQAKNDRKAKEMLKYFINKEDAKKYTPQSNQYVYLKCPHCNTIRSEKVKLEHVYSCDSIGCIKCSDGISYPNKFMFSLLTQLHVSFTTEYDPKWCIVNNTQRYYDFYFELNNGGKYIIEMDGHHHLKTENKAIDKKKDELAKKNNIKVIRINCQYKDKNSRFKFIKNNIMKSNLKRLFDLKDIHFYIANEYACSDLVKVASDIKKNNPHMTSQDIVKEIGYSQSTIVRWLKIGQELGLCEYDPLEEKKKGILKSNATNTKKLSKRVRVNEENLVFESLSELCEQAPEILGIKLNKSGVSLACANKGQYKGYTFEYIEE